MSQPAAAELNVRSCRGAGDPTNDFALGEDARSRYDMASDISRLIPQGHTRAIALSGMYAPVSHPMG
ncbi:MAG TPA: hypothetical protein VMS31_12060 [Pyrinomonadaceae bacterium]|nr:hypothetical protein [Pyrinomonadaceae bacterium]